MISRLATLGDLVIRSTIGSTNTSNSKDKNTAAIVGTVTLVVFSAGAYYGLSSISRSLAPRVVTQSAQEKANLNWGLPSGIKKTLDKLFEGSPYQSVDALPFYPATLDGEDVQREKMEAPVMKGTIAGYRFIVIKVDTEVPEAWRDVVIDCKAKETLLLYQLYKDGPNKEGIDGAFVWEGGLGDLYLKPEFFTGNFTYPHDGSGPIHSQKDNFERVQNLIKNGVGEDLRGWTWKIPKN